jgi:cellobiose phosphorylase
MYRLVVESLLGLRLDGDKLHLLPCPPADWQGFKVHYRYRETVYHIAVSQTRTGDDVLGAHMTLTVDGVERPDMAIPLIDDRREHLVAVAYRPH